MQLFRCRNCLPYQWLQIKTVKFWIPPRAKMSKYCVFSHYWIYNLCIFLFSFSFFWPLGVLLPAVKYNLHVVLCRLDTVNFWSCFSIDLDCHMGILFSWSLFPESEILFYPSLGLSAAILSRPSGIAHEREGSKA